jgi:predicted O-linked N-acetylglucosamine transferase (SPINDLY family)
VKKSVILEMHTLQTAKKYPEMEKVARSLTKKFPRDPLAWRALGVALKLQGKDGLEAFERVVKLIPKNALSHFHVGVQLEGLGRTREAIASYNKTIELDPNSAEAYNNLGNALKAIIKPYDALVCHQKAIHLNPKLAQGYMNLGGDLLGIGHHGKAVECYKKVLEIDPDFVEAYSNLIFAQDFMAILDARTHIHARRDWAENYVDHLLPGEPENDNDPDPDRKLRIGYVGGDFKEHSAARVWGSVVTGYDRSKFDVYCYNNNTTKGDSYKERFMAAATHWREIGAMHDLDIVKLIRQDKIDILVDLAGHSAMNRLPVFAFHPAPVTVHAWGYATGTGMKKMDYFFGCKGIVAEHEREFFTEEIIDLPCAAGSYFPEPFPDVSPLPFLENQIITFGSMNRMHKATEECYQTWVEVLRAVPNSRFLLKAGELADESSRAATLWNFTKAGIDPNRIKMLGATKWHQHVGAYTLVDIALDPFPHGGGVTCMEGLMMGVPAVTLRWPTLVGRISAAIQTTVGIPDWCADTADDYVKLAVKKAADIEGLKRLRPALRGMFLASPIGNSKVYVSEVERHYREVWRRWCAKKVLDKEKIAA